MHLCNGNSSVLNLIGKRNFNFKISVGPGEVAQLLKCRVPHLHTTAAGTSYMAGKVMVALIGMYGYCFMIEGISVRFI